MSWDSIASIKLPKLQITSSLAVVFLFVDLEESTQSPCVFLVGSSECHEIEWQKKKIFQCYNSGWPLRLRPFALLHPPGKDGTVAKRWLVANGISDGSGGGQKGHIFWWVSYTPEK